MYVSVARRGRRAGPRPRPADFIVREDNVAREVLRVAPADDPMQIALLVDNSQAAARLHPRLSGTALPAFVDGADGPAGVKNQVAIIAHRRAADDPHRLHHRPGASSSKGVDRLFALPGSGTYLLDGIIETSQGFKKREAARPVIVAITTEGPGVERPALRAGARAARASGAALHVDRRSAGRRPAMSDEMRNRNIVLDEGPTADRRPSRRPADQHRRSPAELKQLANELTHQYRVTYARPQSLIPPERVTVAAAKPG